MDFRQGRKQAAFTQVEAASKLGVSQPYLSLLERGERTVPERLARKAVTLYRLSPTVLPLRLKTPPQKVPTVTPQNFAEDLAALKYPGYSYLRSRRKRNPAEVLFLGLAQNDLEPRLAEALPWVVLRYTDMDWNWLISEAKKHDLQNRLGFVVRFAVRVAQSGKADASKLPTLKKNEALLDEARLVKEDTLCHQSLSGAEREWLRQRRSDDARHWNLLTDLTPEHFRYAVA